MSILTYRYGKIVTAGKKALWGHHFSYNILSYLKTYDAYENFWSCLANFRVEMGEFKLNMRKKEVQK